MATIGIDVLNEMDKLIALITGCSGDNENFIACKRYTLSHFMHHTYPSISKTTVRTKIHELENRFYIHGQFQIHEAFKTQVEHFLSQEETFRANPEVEIEWSLLSFLTSLASSLTKLDKVPPLLPLTEDVPEDLFNWGKYLKEDLPSYTYSHDSDSESFSSLSSSSFDEDYISANVDLSEKDVSLSNIASSEQVRDDLEITDLECLKIEEIYNRKLKERDKEIWRRTDSGKGKFATKWRQVEVNLGLTAEPLCILSEREVIESVIHSLMTGEDSRINIGIRSSVSYLSDRAFESLIQYFQVYVKMMASFRQFITNVSASKSKVTGSVVAKAYGSGLRQYLVPYETHLRNLLSDDLTLLKLKEAVRVCVPYIRGLWTVHQDCTAEKTEEEATWVTALRILSALYNGMIMTYKEDLRRAFTGMFLCCHAVIGDILDTMLTSSLPADPGHEFFIQKVIAQNGMDCSFNILPYEDTFSKVFPLVDIISKKVYEAKCSLSLLHVMNRHHHLILTSSINELLFESLKNIYGTEDDDGSESQSEVDVFRETSLLYGESFTFFSHSTSVVDGDFLDFLRLSRWIVNSKNPTPVFKVTERAVLNAVSTKIDAVRSLAVTILVEESKLSRHLTMLRSVFLCNNASLLLPFTNVFFNEESCWENNDYLTLLLRECVAVDFPDLANELSIELIPRTTCGHFSIIEAIQSISIKYEVPYPLSLVITPELMNKYNAIFRVLLQLKWVHRLSNLRFPDKKLKLSAATHYVLHRVQILRFSYLADLNVINNYFMAQVAATLPKPCEEYTDIFYIIKDHEALINRIHARCMLSEGDRNYELIFENMIPICFDLRRMWVLDLEMNLITKLKHIENIYGNSHKRLSRIMAYLEKETYVPCTK